MKSRIWYACLIAMLIVSTVGLGEVITDGDWSGDASGPGGYAGGYWDISVAAASANGSNNYVWGVGGGWMCLYTTVGGYCNWSYTISAEAHANAYGGGGAMAYGIASAYGWCWANGGQTLPADAYVQGQGEDEDEPADLYDFGRDDFSENAGVSGDHSVGALAEVDWGSGQTAYTYTVATISLSLSEE